MTKNLTTQQVVLLIACLALPLVALKLLGSELAAGISYSAGMVLMFVLGRDPPPPPPSDGNAPALRAIPGGLATLALAAVLTGCPLSPPPVTPEDCAAIARADYYGADASVAEAMHAYDECIARNVTK